MTFPYGFRSEKEGALLWRRAVRETAHGGGGGGEPRGKDETERDWMAMITVLKMARFLEVGSQE